MNPHSCEQMVLEQAIRERDRLDLVVEWLRDRLLLEDAKVANTQSCPASDSWFDRSLCACNSMHTRCTDCGKPMGGCPFDECLGPWREGEPATETVGVPSGG